MNICKVPDCDKPVKKIKMCSMHVSRHYRGQPLEGPPQRLPREGRVCEVPGCGRPLHRSRRWCSGHAERHRLHGDVRAHLPLGVTAAMAEGCTVPGCGRPHKTNGLCDLHYGRHITRDGDLSDPDIFDAQGFIAELLARTDWPLEECVIWPGATLDGRAQARIEGRTQFVAPYLLKSAEPKPSPELHCAHICGMGHEACVNLAHLRWATPKENAQDRIMHGTQGSEEQHSRVKLTRVQAQEIYDRRKAGEHPKEIASDYGVHYVTINDIFKGKSWRSLDRD